MTIIRDKQVPGALGPWYPEEGVADRDQAYAYIAEYFPQILSGPNSIGTQIQMSPEIMLESKKNRRFKEPFIAKGKVVDNADSVFELRYYHPRELGGYDWALQFYDRDANFFLAWDGMHGVGSAGVYGNFVDRVDFHFDAETRRLGIKSLPMSKYMFEMTVPFTSDAELSGRLKRFTREHGRGIVLDHAVFTRNLLVLSGNINDGRPGQIAIPSSVTPRRFT